MPGFRFFVLLLLVLSLSSAAGAVETPKPAAKLSPCKVPGENGELDARCGLFEVWENRAARAGRKIRLKVVVLPARSPHPKPDPVFLFGGGPGEAITEEA